MVKAMGGYVDFNLVHIVRGVDPVPDLRPSDSEKPSAQQAWPSARKGRIRRSSNLLRAGEDLDRRSFSENEMP